MDKVLARVIAEGVSEEELERAKKTLIAESVYARDSQQIMARIYGVSLTAGLTVEDVEAWPDRIAAVTADDVRAVAEKYIVPNRSVTGLLLKEAS